MRLCLAFGIGAALSSTSCMTAGGSRSLVVLMAFISGVVVWVVHRGWAWAGGATTTSATGTDASGTADGSGTVGSTGSADGSGTTATTTEDPGTTSEATATSTSEGTTETAETGACLSAPYDGSETQDPEMVVCLCACETGPDRDDDDWAPALVLPVLARRRSRRRSLERIVADGRLPADVVARLRQRIDGAPGRDEGRSS